MFGLRFVTAILAAALFSRGAAAEEKLPATPGIAKVCLTYSDVSLLKELTLPASTVFANLGVLSGNRNDPATWDSDPATITGFGGAIVTLNPVTFTKDNRCSEVKVKMLLEAPYLKKQASASDNHLFSIENVLDYPIPAEKPPVEIGTLIDNGGVLAVLLTDVSNSFTIKTAPENDEAARQAKCLKGAQKLAAHMGAVVGEQTWNRVNIKHASADRLPAPPRTGRC